MTDTNIRDRLQNALEAAYVIERELGGGAMSVVYLARDVRHDRNVVIKVLAPELSHALGPQRFAREIETVAALRHPHILPLLDSGEAAGLIYYVMPFAEGESLRDRMKREQQLPLDEAVRIVSEVASALDYAHRRGIVHRDIKPENILIEDGHAVVADFGIAYALGRSRDDDRLTGTGMSIGTPAYMSPEQASAERAVDARSDVYSLGCVLYEMLAGEQPFTGVNAQAVIAKRLAGEIPRVRTVRPAIPEMVDEVLRKALAVSAADRFPTARAFSDALTTAAAAGAGAHAKKPGRVNRRRRFAAAGVAAIVLIAAGAWLAYRASSAAKAPVANSIAVLPFAYRSAGEDREYLSDGLSEELITALGRVPGLRVAARTSSFQFKGKNPDIHEVGDRLGVASVLEGSVTTDRDKLRVTARLVGVREGFQIWSAAYDRPLVDMLAVQQEIARAIVNALRLELPTGARGAQWAAADVDAAAHDLYLRGRHAWNSRTPEGLRRAVALFSQAVERDSNYAAAYSGLADAYISMFDYGLLPAAEANPRVRQAAERALTLDPASAEAHTSLAHVHLHDWEWEAALREFRRAIELDPGYANAYHWYALALTTLGHVDQAVEAMRQATRLDPLSTRMSADLGMAMYAARQYDEAVAQERRTLRMDSTSATAHWIMGMALEQSGKLSEAEAAFQRALRLRPGNPNFRAALARTYALSGRQREARELLSALESDAGKNPAVSFFVALVHTALGDRENAIAWLERSINERSGSVRYLNVEPRLDPIRSDPRFGDLLLRAKLPR